ncbi:MAG: hypothetical protein V8Q79_07170 [Christensenellales bacterium]
MPLVLQTEYVDFYLFHALNGERWEQAKAMGIVGYLEEQQRGRIRHFGSSFDDSYEVFEKILTEREWNFLSDSVQLYGYGNSGGHERL